MSGRLFTDEQFWSRVLKTDDGCWFWTGTYGGSAYGQLSIRVNGEPTTIQAHVMSYEIHHGRPVPDGYEIDHLCRNRSCVRIDHLEAVSHRENVRRAAALNRRRDVDPQSFAGRLRDYIDAHELTQVELAEMLGAQPATVSTWVNGHRLPHSRFLIALEALMGDVGEKAA